MAANDEQLEQMFRCIDVDQDGSISAVELQEALLKGGMEFDLRAATDLLCACSPDGMGRVTRQTFDRFQKLLWKLLSELRSLYGQFDSETLSYEQVEQAVRESGFKVDNTALLALHGRFDPLSTEQYTFSMFTELLLFLRGAATAFNMYDPRQEGIVKLTFHQYLHASSYTI